MGTQGSSEGLAARTARVRRKTKETDIDLGLSLGGGKVELDFRALGFFGHMLNAMATYAGFGLSLSAKGDKYVDDHHTVEDVGLVLGEALAGCLGDYSGHARFGQALAPMDEALAEAAVDIGRRPYLRFQVDWPQPVTGTFELCLVEEFFRAFSQRAGMTLHLTGRHGNNSHHLCEALFKATGLALARATAPRDQKGPLSTKGVL
ncbi:MAG: imidazoleglycerol-phosphate dehydratase HisB [Deltaproteobacteria bacterium]|jgi:imidazoleglycerol-phosphate dehydratase|nr:imidazoleglycerol-phosphate dehydratase HisB [Deltaproteobacteria bacterium]